MTTTRRKKTSPFMTFARAVQDCINGLGFGGAWDVTVTHDAKIPEQATCTADAAGRIAKIVYGGASDRDEIPRLARHEVAHLLLAEMRESARKRFVSEDELEAAEERVCTVLEKVLP